MNLTKAFLIFFSVLSYLFIFNLSIVQQAIALNTQNLILEAGQSNQSH